MLVSCYLNLTSNALIVYDCIILLCDVLECFSRLDWAVMWRWSVRGWVSFNILKL